MDASVSSAVSASLYMNQAQTAQQVQMQVFKDGLDNQQEKVTALMESATTGSGAQQSLASKGNLGTQINTFA